MRSVIIFFSLFMTLSAFAEFDPNSLAPARVLGTYPDKDSSTGKSFVIANGNGISVVRVPGAGARDLMSSLWGDCRAVLPIKDASTFSDSGFCQAKRNPQFDQPNRGLEAYTFNTPEVAAKNYRKSVIFSLLTLLPGRLFSSSSVTSTFLIPVNESDLAHNDLEVEIRLYRGTINNPEKTVLKLKAVK